MADPLDQALAEVRTALLDAAGLHRAVAAGRRRGKTPSWVRAELRPVALKRGDALQVVTSDGARPATRNLAWGSAAEAAVDELLAEPFGNWHVETASGTLQLRVTKKGDAQVHRSAAVAPAAPTAHDREKAYLLDPGDPLFAAIGANAAKRRQIDAFLRSLAATMDIPTAGTELPAAGNEPATARAEPATTKPATTQPATAQPATTQPATAGPEPATTGTEFPVDAADIPVDVAGAAPGTDRPLRVVDLGCGNAYLTFAAYQYLTGRGLAVEITGVDVREDQRARNTALAETLGCADQVRFVAGSIADAPVEGADVVLALHACDTATDEALARAVGWQARYVLAAPCCHHDIAAQLKRGPAADPYQIITRQPILRERFADVLTDSLRAALLRLHGYQVEVVEFVDSKHTPRNLMVRGQRTGAPATPAQRAEYARLVDAWAVRPALADMLDYPR
jgi:SAM-dependent methyltransferase